MRLEMMRVRLAEIGESRAAHRAEWRELAEELRRLLVEGRAEGLSVSEMCRLSGMSREMAHRILRGDG